MIKFITLLRSIGRVLRLTEVRIGPLGDGDNSQLLSVFHLLIPEPSGTVIALQSPSFRNTASPSCSARY